MKIGIFGDSYTDEKIQKDIAKYPSWVELLRENKQLDIECFGMSGTSLYYSYKKFIENHKKFDKVIFVATSPGRIMIPEYIKIPEGEELYRHLNGPTTAIEHAKRKYSLEYRNACIAAKMYYEYLYDDKKEKLYHRMLINEIKSVRKDLIFVDAFSELENLSLYEVSKREVVGSGLSEDLMNFVDRRMCHLCQENNVRLANLMLKWIYGEKVNYTLDDFVIPNANEIKSLFEKRK